MTKQQEVSTLVPKLWQITQKIFILLPWLWLSLLLLLILGAVSQTGSWPTYGQPDPKQIPGLGLLVTPTTLLMMLTLASLPFGLFFTAFAANQAWSHAVNKKHTAFYLIGVFLFLVILFGDVAGIMTWLLD
ncbi:MAG: hypothetical protein KC445_19915 [Anaerolineales bacterium]|nr:hypothetical protein [Anaerolineales bacterium]